MIFIKNKDNIIHTRDTFKEKFIEFILNNSFYIDFDEIIQKDFKLNFKNCDIMLTIKPKITKKNQKYNINLKINNDNTNRYTYTYDIYSTSNEENITNDSFSSLSKELEETNFKSKNKILRKNINKEEVGTKINLNNIGQSL